MAKVPGVAPWGMSIDALLARAEAGGGTPVESLTPFPAIYGGSQRGARKTHEGGVYRVG